MSGQILQPQIAPQQPVNVVQCMNDMQLVALVAAQIAVSDPNLNADVCVQIAVEYVAEAVAAVSTGKLNRRAKQLIEEAVKRQQEEEAAEHAVLKFAEVPAPAKPA